MAPKALGPAESVHVRDTDKGGPAAQPLSLKAEEEWHTGTGVTVPVLLPSLSVCVRGRGTPRKGLPFSGAK